MGFGDREGLPGTEDFKDSEIKKLKTDLDTATKMLTAIWESCGITEELPPGPSEMDIIIYRCKTFDKLKKENEKMKSQLRNIDALARAAWVLDFPLTAIMEIRERARHYE